MDLTDRVVLITGGGTGVGKATALLLAERGARIVVNYSRSSDSAEETVRELRGRGSDAIAVKADVSKDQDVRDMVAEAIRRLGGIDVLVNNAGITHYVDLNDLEGMREELWDEILAVNVKGAFFATRAAAPHLKKARGCVVNVASIAGFTGKGSSIAYAVSKGALITMTKSLAVALAPEVRVNAVAPGIVLTRWVAGREEHVNRQSAGTPLRKAAQAADVAEVVRAQIESAGHVTGQTWVVDGGVTL